MKISSLCLILLRNKKFFVSFREIIHSLFYRKIIENKLERNKYYFSSKSIIIINLRYCCVVKGNFVINQNSYNEISMIDKSNFVKHLIYLYRYMSKSFILINKLLLYLNYLFYWNVFKRTFIRNNLVTSTYIIEYIYR